MNDYFTFFYVKHFELPMCMKCAIQINLPCLALPCAWCILLTPLGLIPHESWFRVILHHSTAWLDWFPYSVDTRRSTSEILKGNILGYYRNLGSLRYGNEYCIPGHAISCTPRLLPSDKSEMRWQSSWLCSQTLLPCWTHYGGLHSHWLACHRRVLVRFLILHKPIDVQL